MRSGTSVARNIKSAAALIREAAAGGAEFIATPEMTHLLQRDPAALREAVAREEDDAGLTAFRALAEELGVHLLLGSLAILKADGGIANRAFLIDGAGEIAARYDKIHLFEAAISKSESYREADTYAAGDRAVIADVDGLSLGLSICYDVRFARLYDDYAKAGVQMIAVPAAFTVATGKAHWETLLRARAIETGAFILAPAQGGKHADGRKTWGRSMIIGPWGEVIALRDDDKPSVIYAEIDAGLVESARAKIPAWRQS